MGQESLPEMVELERIIEAAGDELQADRVCEVEADGRCFPVYSLVLGKSREVPAIGFFGGVHGLERIGTQVLLVFLRSLLARLKWDTVFRAQLQSLRMVFMPLVNPGGMWRNRRSNPRGVDLMRNAPVNADGPVPPLIGGHRTSRKLPWYRGAAGEEMEAESRALCRVVEAELLSSEFSIALDCHSGFGLRDRIWFPYAHTLDPIPHLAEIHSLSALFDATYPTHNYLFEPQSRQYLAHGDLWDYLYLRALGKPGAIFLPLTLEMGSWLWVKKNPSQLFSRQGIFNPILAHRQQRVLRRHFVWLDFLARAACGYRDWLPAVHERHMHHERARRRWYGGGNP